jgi:hypothetical protein
MQENDTYIEIVKPADLDLTDAKWLDKAISACYYGETIGYVIERCLDNTMQLLRVRNGKVRGIIITQVDTFPIGRVVRIHSMAGVGIFRNTVKILNELQDLARKHDIVMIAGLSNKEAGAYQNAGMTLRGTEFTLEVKDGND